jgi:hypothetical protein
MVLMRQIPASFSPWLEGGRNDIRPAPISAGTRSTVTLIQRDFLWGKAYVAPNVVERLTTPDGILRSADYFES